MSVGDFFGELFKYWYIAMPVICVALAIALIVWSRRFTHRKIKVKKRQHDALVFGLQKQERTIILLDDVEPGSSTRLLNNKPVLLLEITDADQN